MATAARIKSTYDGLKSSGGLDVEALKEEAIRMRMSQQFPNASKEEIQEMTKNVINDASSMLYQQVEREVNQIADMVVSIPETAADLIAQFSTIPASVVGTASAAAAPMVMGVKSQGKALKATILTTLATAIGLGIDIPGIDPILTAADTIQPLL